MYSANGEIHENGRRVAQILADMKNELAEFVETRVTMLRTELVEKWKTLKIAIPLAGVAALFLGSAFLLLTGALVGLVVAAFPQSIYRWFFGCIIVAAFWAIVGGAAAYFAFRECELKSMVPRRTLEVLKGDKVWIEAEVRNRV